MHSIPGSGRSPGGGNSNPVEYSLPGKIPWTEEPGKLQPTGLQRVGYNSTHANIVMHINVNKTPSNIWQKKKVIEVCMQHEFIYFKVMGKQNKKYTN